MKPKADKIQHLRRALGLSRKETAARLKTDYQHYLEIEKGRVDLGADMVTRLADVLGVPMAEVVHGDAPGEVRQSEVGTLGRLLVRQKALIQLLLDKGVIDEKEYKEAFRSASEGS